MIYNPTAGGRRRRRLNQAVARLRERGARVDVRETTAAGDALAFAETAENFDVVAVAGGDGTINEAANGLLRRADAPALGIIPLGTANVFAAEIGYDDSAPETAADVIACGDIRHATVGAANGRVFCQMAGIGFDADVVAGVDVALKRRIGKGAYAWESLRRFWDYRKRMFSVEIDGERREASSVIVANGRFYAGRYICAPAASIDEDCFQVCLFRNAGRLHVARYGLGLLRNRLQYYPDFEILKGRNLRIWASDGGADDPVQGDGDVIARLPVDIALSAKRLAIVKP